MKNLLQKLRNNKFGFSLIELIVVIAIMVVIAVVLVPSLMHNVEDSRKNKDIKTTDELVTAVELALADHEVYDEMLEHAIWDNISCYIDKSSEADCANKVVIKASTDEQTEQYEFDDDERQNDEVIYHGAGNMRGVTITFTPVKDTNESHYVLKDAVINKFTGRMTGYLYENEKLYNAIRSVVGDKIYNSSQTYRNSDFTVFIRMGTTGANDAKNQDATKIYGQYNGTNLPYDETQTCVMATNRIVGNYGDNDDELNKLLNQTSNEKINFSETSLMGSGVTYSSNLTTNDLLKSEYQIIIHNDVIPEGGVYYVGVTATKAGQYTGATATYNAGDKFPTTPKTGDVYVYGDYEYRYNYYMSIVTTFMNGQIDLTRTTYTWKQKTDLNNWNVRPIDNKKTSYGDLVAELNGMPISDLTNVFSNCYNLQEAPKLSNRVTNLKSAFYYCVNLKTAPTIPNSVTNLSSTFKFCEKMEALPEIPYGITSLTSTFYGCANIKSLDGYEIPESVTSIENTFGKCTGLENLNGFKIPSKVNDLYWTFVYCSGLTDLSNFEIPNNITKMTCTFLDCTGLTDVSGLKIPNSVTYIGGLFSGCTNLTVAPPLHDGITNMVQTFEECKSLKAAPKLPKNLTTLQSTFYYCTSLEEAPEIPNKVTTLHYAFYYCTSLKSAPVIPSSVTDINNAFNNCTSMTGTIEVNTTISSSSKYKNALYKSQITEVTGTASSTFKTNLLNTVTNYTSSGGGFF